MMYTNRLLVLAVALAGTACSDHYIHEIDTCPIEGGWCLRGQVLDLGTGETDCSERLVQLVEVRSPMVGPRRIKVLAEAWACEDGSFSMTDVPLVPSDDRYLVVSEDGEWPAVATPVGRSPFGTQPAGEWLRGEVAWSVDAELAEDILDGLELADEESNIYATGAILGFVESERGHPIDSVEVSCDYCERTYYFDDNVEDGLFTQMLHWPWENPPPFRPVLRNESTSAEAGAMFLVPTRHEVYLDAYGPVPYGFEETYAQPVPGMLTMARIEGRPFIHPLDEDLLP